MTKFVALLRAINVGGTGKLPMTDLKALCEDAGCTQVRTYIASGNVVFLSDRSEGDIRAVLEARLLAFAGKAIGVLVRSADDMEEAVAGNPFPQAPGNQVAVLFSDEPIPQDPAAAATGIAREQIRPGSRHLYIHYPDGMWQSRLRLPAEKRGTARNMNTVAKLAEMAAGLT